MKFVTTGKFLKSKRLAKNLTQREVGKALRYRSQFIANWERGASQPPLKVFRKITKLYGIPKAEMLSFLLTQNKALLQKALK